MSEQKTIQEQPLTKKSISGATAVVQSLLEEQVDTIFGYPGGAIMPVYDSLYHFKEELNHILTRHEQGAIHAAQGYARVTGKVGVCMVTSGPGVTNCITGLADAYIDSTPLICISGQVSSQFLGTDAFQETDVVGISMPVTKWNVQITDANDIPAAFAKAFYIARSGRPGPVLIDITKDAQFQSFDFAYEPCELVQGYAPQPEIDTSAIQEAVTLINEAKKPMILFGQGVILADAKEEFKAFVEKSGIPSAWTILGLSALDHDHKLNVGMLGMHGNYAPNKLTNDCDLIIAIGMRFDDRVTGDAKRYAENAKVIHLEVDPAEINKIIDADVPIIGDCKKSLPLLTAAIEKRDHDSWHNTFKALHEEEVKEVIYDELYPSEEQDISMGEVIRMLSEKTNGEAIIVTDVGQHQMVAQRYYKFTKWNSNVTSGGLGTMGFALPAAIGAKIGKPERLVVAVIGDGGFQMTIQELGTIFQEKTDVKILILNNEFLGMVRQWQELFFEKRYAFTTMINPDFQTIAKGYHIPAEKVTERKDLASAIDRFISNKESCLLEVLVGKENNVFPMVASGSSVSEIRLK